ncbi:hypothetical protein ACH41H_44740 [Streptomyces sp. NPDC020800]|uniref:hypothetical protein n=1 Tax=Streptomyces sp. NPDC020800 TaxID=3365092 RepID=UPI00379F9A40
MYMTPLDGYHRPDATWLLTSRPATKTKYLMYEPLPQGLALHDAVLLYAGDVRAGDLVIAEFGGKPAARVSVHLRTPYAADPHTVSDCPCAGCVRCKDFDGAEPHTLPGRDERWACLAPSDGEEPCWVYSVATPLAVIPAAAVRARTGRPAA